MFCLCHVVVVCCVFTCCWGVLSMRIFTPIQKGPSPHRGPPQPTGRWASGYGGPERAGFDPRVFGGLETPKAVCHCSSCSFYFTRRCSPHLGVGVVLLHTCYALHPLCPPPLGRVFLTQIHLTPTHLTATQLARAPFAPTQLPQTCSPHSYSVSQSVNQSVSQSISQSVRQSVSQSISQSVAHPPTPARTHSHTSLSLTHTHVSLHCACSWRGEVADAPESPVNG